MRQIEQVVVHELIVRREVVIARHRLPGRVVHPVEIRDAGGVGQRRLAQPDPREGVALDQRIFAHARPRRHLVLPGHPHALAVAVKAQSMVAALDLVSDDAAERQRREAMRAAVGKRDRLARGGAEQHDLLAAHGAGERRRSRSRCRRR